MALENIDNLAEDLEKQELQAQGGVASAQLYGKLLAIYLYQFDLCNAKFLWKRIPHNIKNQSVELKNIWAVGKAMWLRDAPGIYTALNNTIWSDNVDEIMSALKVKVREKCIGLVCKAYASLNVETFAKLVGVNNTEAVEMVKKQGWNIDNNIITPGLRQTPATNVTSTEEQLHKLTNFVSFLEN